MFVCAYYGAKDNVKHVKSMQHKIQVGAASACYASKQSLYHGNEKRVTYNYNWVCIVGSTRCQCYYMYVTLYYVKLRIHCMCNLTMHSGCM